ncbi:uncharacterized protein [Haliotis asinina]|uniref:uncharacterized protein n=1 Tax=Haliotis asinina TaxID=109174 RepID=UPI0035327056
MVQSMSLSPVHTIMGVITAPGRCLLMAMLLAPSFCNFINFDPGYEYQYKFSSKTQLNRVGDFHVSGKVGYINVGDSVEGQEIYLRVYALGISNGPNSDTISHQWDFSKWFSFVITRKGEITHVYHPPDDDEEAVAMKKGFSALFASRLHQESDVPTERLPQGWSYHVLETGHEGLHNATYTVQPSVEGHVFTKTRHPDDHPVEHATSNYTKTLYYNRELGTVHTVVIDETFQTMHKVADGFDPHSTGRPVKPVNQLQDMEFPEMSALALGKLQFLTKHKVHDVPVKGPSRIEKSSIHLGNVKQKKTPVNVDEYLEYLEKNLTCMREEPEQGSKRMSMCFSRVVSTLKALPDKVLADFAERYFSRTPTSKRKHKDQNFLFDAVAVLENNLSQNLLFTHILNRTRPNQYLFKRLLVHIVSMETPPIDAIIHKLTQLCFYPPMSFLELLEKDTHQRIVLATGVVARRLWDAGRKRESEDIVKNLEKWLGLHDPYVYRKARSVMKEEHLQLVDHYRVVLLGALGNAALFRSYEHIVSHINSTNSQWVKRAGIHALRKYHHEKTADLMLRAALYDDDEKVRYEALLQYQAHPRAVAVAPMYMEKGVINGSIFYADPRDVGIHDFNMHHRDKRSVEDFINKKWEYNLKSPSVDWQKMIGSTKIGAAFGLIIKNELDLKFSLLNSHAKLDIHDEAYARLHLGFMDKTMELFFGRICFKAGASYDMNMMKENAKGDLKKLFDLFFNIKDNAINAIGTGTELFRSLANGDMNLDHVFEDFKTALEELPGKSLMETATVVIPTAAKEIFKDINKVIRSFRTFDKNPKAAISNIAACVMSVKGHVANVITAVMDVKDKCSFIHGKKPDWMKMDGPIGEIISLAKTAFTTLGKGGMKWVMESVKNDEIAIFSHGKSSMRSEKDRLLTLLNEILDDMLGPLKGLKNMGAKFLGVFHKVYRVVMDIKEAYNILKNGFGSARSFIDRLFGPKFHKDFPNSRREKGGGCSGFGTYPSRLGTGTEYAHDGVDVLLKTGENIISPFHGVMTLSEDPNEVILDIRGGSLKDTHIYITNIKPNDTITRSEPIKVLRGQVIGVSTESPCKGHAHIHVSMRRDGGFIDPTHYLEPRVPGLPGWNQECDDYKVVLKDNTIAEGCILCLDGKKTVDTSPEKLGSGDDTMIYQLISGSFGGGGGGGGGGGILDKITANIDKLIGSKDNALSTLFKDAVKFVKNFSIRNIKLGSIIDVLDVLELHETKKHVAEIIRNIKAMMDKKPCLNPYQYTDKQLRAELRDRGKRAVGSRDDMIKVLTTPSTGLDQKIQTGLVLDVLGGIELIVRIKLEKSEKAMLISIGAGFCSVSNLDRCQGFFYVLDKAVTPLPMCNPDGTMTWPDIDYKSLLDFGKLKDKLKDTAFRLAKDGIDRLLTLLPCISPDVSDITY